MGEGSMGMKGAGTRVFRQKNGGVIVVPSGREYRPAFDDVEITGVRCLMIASAYDSALNEGNCAVANGLTGALEPVSSVRLRSREAWV